MILEMNERSRQVFKYIVDSYLATGLAVGSRTISQNTPLGLSAASIRNTMSDLERAGLLYAPHTSAGRLPTEQGIRLYIEGLMQMDNLSQEERESINSACTAANRPINEVLEQATTLLSGLSSCASLVIAPKMEGSIKQIQFAQVSPQKVLAILVFQNGLVENRVLEVEGQISSSHLTSAANYLNAHLSGKSIGEAEKNIRQEISENKTQLDQITQSLVERGLAVPPKDSLDGRIIIRGQSRLLQDLKALEDLERARELLAYLEQQQNMLKLLSNVGDAEGVQIFIGTENEIFDQSGWSLILSPYKNLDQKIVGAIGVIGPTRLDYDRIIPMVDYTSRVVSKIVDGI